MSQPVAAPPRDIDDAVRDTVFSPLGGENLVYKTVRRLGEAIGMGLLSLGEQLPPESELAARLEISLMTLRQALGILRESGYLETSRGRGGGTFVKRSEPYPPPEGAELFTDDLRELTEFRIAVSGHSAALAAKHITDPELAQLGQLHDEMRNSTHFLRYRQLDSRFHLGIAAAARCQRLMTAEADIQRDLQPWLLNIGERLSTQGVSLDAKGSLKHSNRLHAKILAALKSADGETARSEMEIHVRGTLDAVVGLRLGA